MRFALALVLMSSVAFADRAAPPPGSGAPSAERTAGFAPRPSRPPLPPPPPVPGDIAARGKQVVGSYACKGTRMQNDGSSRPIQAKLAIKLDLENAWLVSTFTGDLKLVDYRTYDATSKQWSRFIMLNDASHESLASTGEKNGEWLWEGQASSQTGNLQVRHHESLDKKTLKIFGEAMLGGTWQKTYEATCTR